MLIEKLDRVIKSVWLNEIYCDFLSCKILNEDTLKNSIYYHLRTNFNYDINLKDLLIYTECTHYDFKKDLNYIPDIIIATKDFTKTPNYNDCYINDVIAILELKYKSKNCYRVDKLVYNDYDKLHKYKSLYPNAQLYNCAITLGDFDRAEWLDKEETNQWAKNCVTELNAYEPNEKIEFQVFSYNNMNKDLNTK